MTKTADCKHCEKATELVLHRQKFINGSDHFVWVCDKCQRINPSSLGGVYIPHESVYAKLSTQQIEELPILMPEASNRCVVCGDRNCELHHWAPKFLFGEHAEQWPKDYLCRKCHGMWHTAVTPQLKGASNGFE